jgi:hypothetical protein
MDATTSTRRNGTMDKRQLEALVKKNAAKAASATSTRKGFGKKYDPNLADDPIDEASLKERERAELFFKEMRKREF